MRYAHFDFNIRLFNDRDERRAAIDWDLALCAVDFLSAHERDFFIEDQDAINGGTVLRRASNQQGSADCRQARPRRVTLAVRGPHCA
jgi:hypothetical protein